MPPSSLPSCLSVESCSASPARLGGQELTGLFVRMTGIGITSFLLIRTGGRPEVFCSVSQICYSRFPIVFNLTLFLLFWALFNSKKISVVFF